MRLYTEVEETNKKVIVEDYSTFRNLLKSKWLFYLLIAYTAYVVINAVLAFLDGGIVMGVINAGVHGVICVSMWLFKKGNEHYEGDKFSTKGTKMFQIAHALKYVVLFVILVLVIILIIFAWIDAANVANQEYINAKDKVNLDIEFFKAAKTKVFWSYLGLTIGMILFSIFSCVYYKAVMSFVDGVEKYHEKGRHCWNELKFLGIYLFVTAGVIVVLGLLSTLGILDSVYEKISLSSSVLSSLTGGLGLLSYIGRIIFAIICCCMGVLCMKGYKTLSTTETSHEEIFELPQEEI